MKKRLLEVEYEDIFKPETMAALKGKSGESLRAMLGNKNLMQTMLLSRCQQQLILGWNQWQNHWQEHVLFPW